MEVIRVIDFETTGMPPDASVCEAGRQDILADGTFCGCDSVLVNPGCPIPPEAKAVHHIDELLVADAPAFSEILEWMTDGADLFAAHNAAFERSFFDGGGKPWICTLKVARRVWPDAPGHGNQVLRYWRNLPLSLANAQPPHRALPDAYVTAWLLRDLLKAGTSIDDMVQWTEEPSLLPRVTFGKHRGKMWSEVPGDYLEWIVTKSDLDEDTKFTARHHMGAREER